MKVKDLIALLQKENPEAECVRYSSDFADYYLTEITNLIPTNNVYPGNNINEGNIKAKQFNIYTTKKGKNKTDVLIFE